MLCKKRMHWQLVRHSRVCRHAAYAYIPVCESAPSTCTKLPGSATQCGDIYVRFGVMFQYPQDMQPNCTNMYVSGPRRTVVTRDLTRPGIWRDTNSLLPATGRSTAHLTRGLSTQASSAPCRSAPCMVPIHTWRPFPRFVPDPAKPQTPGFNPNCLVQCCRTLRNFSMPSLPGNTFLGPARIGNLYGNRYDQPEPSYWPACLYRPITIRCRVITEWPNLQSLSATPFSGSPGIRGMYAPEIRTLCAQRKTAQDLFAYLDPPQ
jgi:hypothetical protein